MSEIFFNLLSLQQTHELSGWMTQQLVLILITFPVESNFFSRVNSKGEIVFKIFIFPPWGFGFKKL